MHFLAFLFLGAISHAEESPEDTSPVPDYSHLTTKDGREFFDCFVRQADAEGLLVEHRGGMAKILFFDLDKEIQDAYDFDPIVAMKVYRETREADRALRKTRLLEAEKIRAEQARVSAVRELQERAASEWTPIEARILSVEGDTAYARVRKVVFKPTTRISTLGFENPGPPKRDTEPLGDGAIYLRNPGPRFTRGATWKGFMEPFATGKKPHPSQKEKSVPVHLAVPPP